MSDVLVGARYGRWLVLSVDPSTRRASCRCRCGLVQQVTFAGLTSGETRGCYLCARRTPAEAKRARLDVPARLPNCGARSADGMRAEKRLAVRIGNDPSHPREGRGVAIKCSAFEAGRPPHRGRTQAHLAPAR